MWKHGKCVSANVRTHTHLKNWHWNTPHGTNFIFSNRDLRSPQASAPSSFSLFPEMHCTGLLFSSWEYFSSLPSPSRSSSAPSSHSGVLIFRTSWRACRKHKKRYLYESVFYSFFLQRLFLSSRSFTPFEILPCVFLRARLVPWRPFHPAPSGNRNEGRKWLTFETFSTDNLYPHMHIPAHMWNEQPLASLQIPWTFDESRMPIAPDFANERWKSRGSSLSLKCIKRHDCLYRLIILFILLFNFQDRKQPFSNCLEIIWEKFFKACDTKWNLLRSCNNSLFSFNCQKMHFIL